MLLAIIINAKLFISVKQIDLTNRISWIDTDEWKCGKEKHSLYKV